MSRHNHIATYLPDANNKPLWRPQALRDLSAWLEANEPTISYVKVRSSNPDNLRSGELASIVKGSAMKLCVPGDVVVELQRLWDKKWHQALARLAKKWFAAIELPVRLLQDDKLAQLIGDHFQKKVIKVGSLESPTDPANTPEGFSSAIDLAEWYGADHIILEGGLAGSRWIYHINGVPNILLVHGAMEKVKDTSRLIIWWGYTIWRDVYGKEAHVWDLELENINEVQSLGIPKTHWERLQEFHAKLKGMADAWKFGKITWKDIVGSEAFNMQIMTRLPKLAGAAEDELEDVIMDILFQDADLRRRRNPGEALVQALHEELGKDFSST